MLVVDLLTHLELDHPTLRQALVFRSFTVELLLGLTWQGEPQGASHLALGVLLEACSLHLHEPLEGVVLWFWPVVQNGTLRRSCAGMRSSGPVPIPRGASSDRDVVWDLPVYDVDQVGHATVVHVPYALVEPWVYV